MKTEIIYVRVGKKVRQAKARITGAGIAVIYTESGPVEVKKWYKTEEAAMTADAPNIVGSVRTGETECLD